MNSLLTERFVNLFNNKQGHDEKRLEYVNQVWSILQHQYKDIGGIKGSGFRTKEDMLVNIPFWKLITYNGTVHGVVMYKDKGGRKIVAAGYLANSVYGKKKVVEIAKHDLKRSYGEKSKASLGSMMKTVPWDILEPLMIKPKRSHKIIPITDLNRNEIPEDGQFTLKKYPQLRPYAYVRVIGGDYIFKVSLGTTGIPIR